MCLQRGLGRYSYRCLRGILVVFVVFVCLQRYLEGGIRIGSSGAYLRCFRGVLGGVFEVFFS